MGLKRILTALAATALTVALAAPAVRAESLADTLVAAYRNSNLLEQNRALLRAADEDVVQARSVLLPVVEFITNASLGERTSRPGISSSSRQIGAEIAAQMTLWDFGRGAAGVEVAREQVLALRAGLIGVEQGVLLTAIVAYVEMQTASQVIGLRQSNVRLIEQELRAARERFELGDSTRTDVAIAEARLAAARSALAAAEGDLAVAREEFRLAVGRYPGALAGLPRLPSLPTSLDAAQGTARAMHPSITQAQHQVRAAQLQSQIARRERFGTVSGSVSAGVSDGGTSPSQVGPTSATTTDIGGGVSWRIPIYTGGRLPSGERQAIARQQGQSFALHQTVAEVQQFVGSSWAQLSVARARLQASDQQIEAAQAAFEAVRAEAELGARTTLDVLNAEQELLDAQFARIEAAAQLQLASYSLLEATGQLTVSALNLGIPTYDVEAYSSGFSPAARTPSVQGRRLDAIMGRYRN